MAAPDRVKIDCIRNQSPRVRCTNFLEALMQDHSRSGCNASDERLNGPFGRHGARLSGQEGP
jgi:hypothetical protein